MIVKQYIKDFEAMGLGIFVHFGIYSTFGYGEWVKKSPRIDPYEYEKLAEFFCPKPEWARELAAAAKGAGAKYITLTSRHHDGYSLYDTQGLSDFDSATYFGRDLIREFVDACREQNLTPFFYHTLVDWHEPSYQSDFKSYLKFLRASVEKLCVNYGKIGGLWFDGTWDKPNADWEEDALYSMIRSHQPEAMIINNTGMDARGALGHIELDSVTFERGKPRPINLDRSPKYIASEMCQVMNNHWGYARNDFSYCSMAAIIGELAACRRCGANYLLNVGPMGDGSLRTIDKGILEILGQWVALNEEALRRPRPTNISIDDYPNDFILKSSDVYYLFVTDIPEFNGPDAFYIKRFRLEERIKEVYMLDEDCPLPFSQSDEYAEIKVPANEYGMNLLVRIAKIVV